MMRILSLAFIALLLSACGEKDQSMTGTSTKADTQAWNGVTNSYQQAGWQSGDKASWEKHLRTRGQHQNEYNKIN
jgi:hypothetical protein